jgi:hypothetical protein
MADEPSPSEFLISKMEGMDEIMGQLVRAEQGQVRRTRRQAQRGGPRRNFTAVR